jgi:hypothetical protein
VNQCVQPPFARELIANGQMPAEDVEMSNTRRGCR